MAVRGQQLELFHFLYRGQQVALDALRQQLHRVAIDPHAGSSDPLLQPARQFAGIHRPQLNRGPGLVKRLVPLAVDGLLVDLAGDDQQHIVGGGDFEVLEQGLAALGAGFAAGQADLQQAAVGEQRQVAGALQYHLPVEVLAASLDHLALVAAGGAGGGADGVGALLDQQGFVAADQVDGK